ncbi:MAG: hypothetical protein ACR2NZ_17770 [Rubripirellula sp.]
MLNASCGVPASRFLGSDHGTVNAWGVSLAKVRRREFFDAAGPRSKRQERIKTPGVVDGWDTKG